MVKYFGGTAAHLGTCDSHFGSSRVWALLLLPLCCDSGMCTLRLASINKVVRIVTCRDVRSVPSTNLRYLTAVHFSSF